MFLGYLFLEGLEKEGPKAKSQQSIMLEKMIFHFWESALVCKWLHRVCKK